jgi:hypothetical protein
LPICIYKIEYSDRKQEERQKIEYIFLSKIKSGALKCRVKEICDFKLFTKKEILAEEHMYPQIKQIIKEIPEEK